MARHMLQVILLVIFGCVSGGVVCAQPAAPAPVTTASTPVVNQSAPLMAGDTVSVVVAGEPQVTGTYTVREDGRIIFPLAGDCQAAGRTPLQLCDWLGQKLKRFVVQPVVAVNLLSAQPRTVTLLGDVPRPGSYDCRQATTLHALVAVCGGVNPTGDLQKAQLVRSGQVNPLLTQGQVELPDLALQPGDVITIPSRGTASVQVAGSVKTPGSYPLVQCSTAGRALLTAGNVAPEGDACAAYVLRGNERMPVNLASFAMPGAPAGQDEALQPGDMLVIPQKAVASVYVVGEVKSPGPLSTVNATRVSAAVAQAGGMLTTADGARAYILRGQERRPVNLAALLQEGSAAEDTSLQAGDVLVVPTQSGSVYLLGQVLKPGPQPLAAAQSLLALWSLGGGPTADSDLRHAQLQRGDQCIAVNLEALERGQKCEDIPLQPGDRLLVPKHTRQIYVLGQVLKPGVQPLVEGDTLLDVLARTGGPTASAAVERIAIVRKLTPEQLATAREAAAAGGKRPVNQAVNKNCPEAKLRRAIECGLDIRFLDLARVPNSVDIYQAQPGDLIYVPALRERRVDWLTVLLTLGTALLVNN